MRVRIWSAALLAACCAGCGTAGQPRPAQPAIAVVKPEWLPPQGAEWAVLDCKAKTAAVGGYDWIDAVLKRGEARRACLEAYGIQP